MTIFAAAARLHAAAAAGDAPAADGDGQARALLAELGYLAPGAGRPTADSPTQHSARDRLLALAARLADVFTLPPSFAPGTRFVGALADPAAFDLDGTARLSAGGIGATLAAAFEGCMGEMAETLSLPERSEDPRIASAAPLPAGDADLADWVRDGLGLAGALSSDLPAVAARRAADGGDVRVPAELVLRRRSGNRRCLGLPDKTGVAAGEAHAQATAAALLELVERDAIALWWFAQRPPPRVTLPAGGWPRLALTVNGAGRDPSRPHWFLDLTTDVGIPVLACCSALRDGTAVVAGFAADPSPERAAVRAFMEMCQMELAQQLALLKQREAGDAALQPTDLTWLRRHREHATGTCPLLAGIGAAPPPAAVPGADRLATTLRQLHAAGFGAYICDLTRPDLAIAVVRAIVPGLQPFRADWIGPRLQAAAATTGADLAATRRSLAPI